MRKRIIIEIENTNVEGESRTGVDEFLFDSGVGMETDLDPEWPTRAGIWYTVHNISVEDI